MRCAIYARVSTVDQDCEIQLAYLRGFAKNHDWVATEYVEKLSGKEGVKRPELERLLADAKVRKFEVVVVHKLDRFGRSTLDTLGNVGALDRAGVRFIAPESDIDTDRRSPMAKFQLQILAAVAELERSFIHERTVTGQIAYRKSFAAGRVGKDRDRQSKSGKNLAVGRPKKIFDRRRVLDLQRAGKSLRQIATTLGVGKGTVERALRAVPKPG
jgi:putative DNA-invertase from lambdoid prophage Rac